jgi:predicted GH43/DUF377 family glycosyl hydrolase
MKWKKLGVVFNASNHSPWMVTHASNPVAEVLQDDFVRIYFSTRDAENRSSVGSLVINLNNPAKIEDLASTPHIAPGEPGLFDDSGVSMGCLARVDGELRMYYLGWNLGVTVPWRNSIGLAISRDGGKTFVKHSRAPLLDRNEQDPFSISYPWVMQESPADWKMWYGSNLRWGREQTDMAHLLKYADSSDGLSWRREGRIAIPFKSPDEYAMSKPCVIRDADRYRMWYSYRGKAYRIGYAESSDGITWERMDNEVGITASESGWDSETVEYPDVFDSGGTRFMLYNGNRYGQTGFGLAVFE